MFMVFAGWDYYPQGGAYDWQRSFPDLLAALDECGAQMQVPENDWCHVFDTDTNKEVFSARHWPDKRISPSYIDYKSARFDGSRRAPNFATVITDMRTMTPVAESITSAQRSAPDF